MKLEFNELLSSFAFNLNSRTYALAVDSAYAARGLMPRWLMPLRFALTAAAILGLAGNGERAWGVAGTAHLRTAMHGTAD